MNYNIDDYPAVKDYLLSFGMEKLEQTGKEYIIDGVKVKTRKKTNNKWFETQDSISYWDRKSCEEKSPIGQNLQLMLVVNSAQRQLLSL